MAAYDSFIGSVLRPKNLETLKDPYTYESIQITIMRPDGPEETLELKDIYPFHTLADLETAIYYLKDLDDVYHPQNLCLMLLQEDGTYQHLQAYHTRLNARSGVEEISLEDPFTQMLEDSVDLRFVDLAGTRNPNVQTVLRHDYLLESVFLQKDKAEYEIHCFLYSDALSQFPGVTQPISAIDWTGRFQIFWPIYPKVQEDGSVSDAELEYAPKRVENFLIRQELLKQLDTLLQERDAGNFRIPGVTSREDPGKMGNFKNLRLAWTPQQFSEELYEPFRVESIFYEMPVSQDVPYMRFWPRNASPLSKVHVAGALNMPTLERPEILLQWAGKKSKSLTPDEDLLMIKLRIRSGSGTNAPFYGTLFIFEDGSAKLVIQPNEEMKKVSRIADLQNLDIVLDRVMRTVPPLQPRSGSGVEPLRLFPVEHMVLEDCYAVFDIFLPKEDHFALTKEYIESVLPYFQAVFQVTTSPITEQNPVVFLRYKAMDNFRIPSRDFQFLWRLMDLEKLHGKPNEDIKKSLLTFYKQEYGVSDSVAVKRIAEFLASGFDFEKTAKATEVQIRMKNNPGIDIAIFGKAPYYYFHFYRVNDLLTFQRLITLMSLFLTVTPSDFPKQLLGLAKKQGATDREEQEEADRYAASAGGSSAAGGPPGLALEQAANALLASRVAEGNGEAVFDFQDDGLELDLGEANVGDLVPAAGAPGAPARPLAQLAALDEDDEEGGGGAGNAGEEDEDEITDVKQLQQQPAFVYFRKRLYFYDKQLFNWEKTHPSAKKYPIRCQSAQMKQPAIMSHSEYTIMRDIYADDEDAGRVIFIEYPIPKGVKYPDLKGKAGVKAEIITVLKYGVNYAQGDANYFVCSQFWCRKDGIIVLKGDFEKGWDHSRDPEWKGPKMRRKEPNSCPFCGGGLVANTRKTIKGETVIERSFGKKKGVEKHHTFVGFLGKQRHPDGYYLPCCFLKEEKIFEDKHPAFKDFVAPPRRPLAGAPAALAPIPAEPVAAALAEQEEEEDLAQVNREAYGAALDDGRLEAATADYAKKLADIPNSYILGSEKVPLDVKRGSPEVGACSEAVERYFSQFPSVGVIRKHDHTVWKLMTNPDGEVNASGFFRIACENTSRYQAESFFAAIAPYFGMRSALEIKEQLLRFIQPPLFLMLNYGNFLFDFYNPSTRIPSKNPMTTLQPFARNSLALRVGVGKYNDALARVWKAYEGFKAYMRNDRSVKEYRLFAQMLSLPGFFTTTTMDGEPIQKGVLFIVLEVSKDGTVTVRCPPFGVSREVAENCDIAFILKYHTGVWEPLFYTMNKPSEGIHKTLMTFAREDQESWPATVKQRADEFIRMCHSSGVGIYTDTYTTKSPVVPIEDLLIPLSQAMELQTLDANVPEEDRVDVHGILRDTYNHVSAVIYKAPTTGDYILVPVIDDGTIHMSASIELDWKNIVLKLASAEVVREFYNKVVYKLVNTLHNHEQRRQLYEIKEEVRKPKFESKKKGEKPPLADMNLFALRLGGDPDSPIPTLYVPVKEDKESGDAWRQITELPWMVDTQIVYGEKQASASFMLDEKDTEEIYQHLRFTFANWLSVNQPVIDEIEKIVFDPIEGRLPNRNTSTWEKRDSLETLFGSVVLSWLDSRLPQTEIRPSLKRIDCTVQVGERACSNRCVWKADENKCLLHVPEQIQQGGRLVDAKRLFLRKLIEELIQFPVKRNDLLENRVYRYIRIRDKTQLKDQLFVPESVPAWAEFLRMEWRQQKQEVPRFMEEMRGIRPLAEGEDFTPAETNSPGSEPELEEELEANASRTPSSAAAAEGEEEDLGANTPRTSSASAEEEAKELPDSLETFFRGIPSLTWWPESRLVDEFGLENLMDYFVNLHDINKETLLEKGQIEDDSVFTNLEVLKEVAKASRHSVLQMEWEPENPVPPIPILVKAHRSGRFTANDAPIYEDVLVILKLPEDPYIVGMLSQNSESPEPITYDLLRNFEPLKKVFKKAPFIEFEE